MSHRILVDVMCETGEVKITTENQIYESGVLLERLHQAMTFLEKTDNCFLMTFLTSNQEVDKALKRRWRGGLWYNLQDVFEKMIINSTDLPFLMKISYISLI